MGTLDDVATPRRAPARWGPPVLAAVVSVLVLGPALGPGVVLAYDLAWSPDPRWTPFALGWGTPAPRAVPSDAVGVALGHVLGAGVAQAVVLLGVLVLAGWGAGRVAHRLSGGSTTASAAAVVAGIWNPFVLERLVVGQWTVLLGYALTPHLMLLAHRARTGPAALPPLAALVALAGAGGANTVALALLAVVPVLLVPRPAWRPLGVAIAVGAGSAAVWALPALSAGVRSGAGGARAFAPRADTPLGPVLSLVSGGGFWNPASHPAERGSLLLAAVATGLAVAAWAVAARMLVRTGSWSLVAPPVLGTVVAVVAVVDPGGAWSWAVAAVPGAGVLRDAQKLVAPVVVLTAAGIGCAVAWLARRRAAGPALAVLVGLLPVLLLPSLAWGVQGRVVAVQVPADLRAAATTLSAAPEGAVGLLPWSQYRRYAWNGDRVSLTLAPRMVDAEVVYDDALPLRDGRVPGEDPTAEAVSREIASGGDPVQALGRVGVRYLLLERRVGSAGPGSEVDLPPGARVLVDGPHALVVDLGAGGRPRGGADGALALGWTVTATTWLATLLALGHAARGGLPGRRRRWGYRLVQSRP